jgi:hypothetical protein
MHLGRLPANTTADAAAMVDKIIAYEGGKPREGVAPCQCDDYEINDEVLGWNDTTLFIADDLEGGGGDFYAYSDEVAEGYIDPPANTKRFVPTPPYTVTKAYLGRTCDVSGNPSPATGCQNLIANTLEVTGSLFVSYVGHAVKFRWATEELMSEALLGTIDKVDNRSCLPIAFPMTCFEGSYHDPTTTSLAEAAVRMPGKGFVASWSPTGFGVVTGHDYLEKGVVLALLHENIERLGPATTYAKQYLEDNAPPLAYRDLLDTYGLIGDPGLRVKTDYVCSLIPTAVLMSSFQAQGEPGGIRLSWQTGGEAEMVGFNLLRREGGSGDFTPLNEALIPAQRAGSADGADYVYLDSGAAGGVSYEYQLQVVQNDASNRFFGPVEARRGAGIYLPIVISN